MVEWGVGVSDMKPVVLGTYLGYGDNSRVLSGADVALVSDRCCCFL